MLIGVTPSGTVGKQVVAIGRKAILKNIIGSPSGANLTVKIRDGGPASLSSEVIFFGRFLSANGVRDIKGKHEFTKGMHVTVIGANGAAYLDLE